MDMKLYAEKKAAGTMTLQQLSKTMYQLISKRFSPETGAEIDPEIVQLNTKAIDDTITNLTNDLQNVQGKIDGLNVLKADMAALDAAGAALVK